MAEGPEVGRAVVAAVHQCPPMVNLQVVGAPADDAFVAIPCQHGGAQTIGHIAIDPYPVPVKHSGSVCGPEVSTDENASVRFTEE